MYSNVAGTHQRECGESLGRNEAFPAGRWVSRFRAHFPHLFIFKCSALLILASLHVCNATLSLTNHFIISGDVALSEIDGPVVKLELMGACGSCPSSSMTMKMGLERKLKEVLHKKFLFRMSMYSFTNKCILLLLSFYLSLENTRDRRSCSDPTQRS